MKVAVLFPDEYRHRRPRQTGGFSKKGGGEEGEKSVVLMVFG